MKTREDFQFHRLNPQGIQSVQRIAEEFSELLDALEGICGAGGREMSLVRTKLQEACFFAKKCVATNLDNQES